MVFFLGCVVGASTGIIVMGLLNAAGRQEDELRCFRAEMRAREAETQLAVYRALDE